ncbi:MAG TPA: FixH family protein [Devosia sp.]|jgi:hypothetical protein|uniref:FixH family protein n=1 Tax=Devosia sp. TaxID=1871048 RepID=UPI002DDCF522|nr:FixH family protein [Devosia sp.]HEV2515688.1 FixH family protein [Devosia sp.]
MASTVFRRLHWAWAIPIGLLLAAAAAKGIMMLLPVPANLDLSTTRVSERGTFTATVVTGPVVVGEPMSWAFKLKASDGSVIDPSTLSLDGGMPQHGHGLPRAPSQASATNNGTFVFSGIEFSMRGWWVINIHRTTASGADQAVFNFQL